MAQAQNNQTRLREGIDAARRGDKLTARRLLQQVLAYEKDNELALMWMASVVDTLEERRSFLNRVLQINPNNERAREALRRLGGEGEEAAPLTREAQTDGGYVGRPGSAARPASDRNTYLLLAGLVAVVVIVLLGVIFLNPSRNTPVQPTQSNIERTFAAASLPTNTPDTRPPTETIIPGIIATFDPNLVSPLPPTFTLTFTPTYTPTPFPSSTPPPLSSFQILYTDFEPDLAVPSLYIGNADGSEEIKLESGSLGGISDVAVSPDGGRIAFVRGVESESAMSTDEAGVETGPAVFPQLFIGPLDDLGAAEAVTDLQGERLTRPVWSPSGQYLLFASDTTSEEGEEDLYLYDLETGVVSPLTDNADRNFDAAYSPDGEFIVFTSDFETPGFTEIYRMKADGTEVTRLTDAAGSSFAPAYSPDGSRIVFVSDRQSDADIYIMDADGSRPFLMTIDDAGAEDRTPTWSPDGRYIVFASNRDGDLYTWYTIDPNGAIVPLRENDRLPQSLTFIPETR